MDKEKIREICATAVHSVAEGLSERFANAISKAVLDSYNQGWEDCKKFFHIKDEYVLKEE